MIREFLKPAITAKLNNDVVIFHGSINLIHQSNIIETSGTITFKWLPSPSFYVELKFLEKQSLGMFKSPYLELEIISTNIRIPFRINSNTIYNCTGYIPFYKEGDINLKCSSFCFEVPNLMAFTYAQKINESPKNNYHSLILKGPGFIFELQNPGTENNYTGLDGGNILNGRGKITFSKKRQTYHECTTLFEMVTTFLTFLHGRYLALLFFQGYDNDKLQFKLFPSNKLDENSLPWNWFTMTINTDYTDHIQQVWESFIDQYKSEDGRECLKLIIHWYIEGTAQRSGVEASIMLIQNALELLCSRVLVEQEQIVDKTDYDKISTSTLINILLNWASIKKEIPATLNDLIALSKANNLSTGPSVLTYIRNCIVHPHDKNRKKYKVVSNVAKRQCLYLSIYYLELITLKYLNYNGLFYNSLSPLPEIEKRMPVPWAIK